nr:uncharacterized protein C16orf52 homolog A [Danaus plexippus plexippus]
MDKLTLISGTLFMTADVFAIVSLAMPDWIITDVGGNYLYSYNDIRFCMNKHILHVNVILVVVFCLAAVIFPMGFHVDEIGGQPYQLPNSHQVGISYILFVLSLWITVISELFAGKVCLPHF